MDARRIIAESVVTRLKECGYSALFAGGCVRDILRGETPFDWDISTDASPKEVQRCFPKTVPVGAQFGVILVIFEGTRFEVSTFRTDEGYADGRHPDRVRYTKDPREDAKRRDFTVNGLFLDPETGEVLDFVGGREDLSRGILRAIGNPASRFQEDQLRMLRAARFVSSLGFAIDPGTASAIRSMATRITSVSAERVRDEILKTLAPPGRRKGVEALRDLCLLDPVLPEVAALEGVRQPPEFHPEGDVLEHTLTMLERAESPSDTLAMGILLHDVGKPGTATETDRIRFNRHAREGAEIAARVCLRLKLSNAQSGRIVALVREHMKFMEIRRMRTSTLKRFLRQDGFEEHLDLHRLDCLASHGKLGNWEFARLKIAEFGKEGLKPSRLIGGRDLMDLHIPRGPRYARILEAVEEEQLSGRIRDRDEAFDFARRLWEEERDHG